MNYTIYRKTDFRLIKEPGRICEQVASYPQKADYRNREFIWSLEKSKSRGDGEMPDFEGFVRKMVAIDGDVILSDQGMSVIKLKADDENDVASRGVKRFGNGISYDLVVKEDGEGSLNIINLTQEKAVLSSESKEEYNRKSDCFYCKTGYAVINMGSDSVMINSGEQLVIDADAEDSEEISIMGEGEAVRAQIWFNYDREDNEPVYIPHEKATFDDFKTCVKLANTRFRGAGYIFKNVKNQWLDEELQISISGIEKFCVNYFVLIVGIVLIVAYGMRHLSTPEIVLSMIVWVVIMMLLVSPLIYFAVVPKPVRKHIKNIDELNSYERKTREEELESNASLDKIMKKYKNTGKK